MQKSILALIGIFCACSFKNVVFAQSTDPSDTLKIIISLLPSKPTLTKNRDSIYVGQAVTLTAANCNGTITWSNGTTGNNMTVSPNQSQFYAAFCTSPFGCVGSKDSIKVNVQNLPFPTASPQTICDGESTTLTAYGCSGGTIKWNTAQTGAVIVANPTYSAGSITPSPIYSETTYSYTCTYPNNGQSQSASVTVKVNFRPQVPAISANPTTILTNGSSTLSVSNCNGTVEWQKESANTWTNDGTGGSKVVTLNKTTNYRARCISAQNCSSSYSGVFTITVSSPIPSVTASASDVCQGTGVTLTASGCSGTYKWNSGQTTPSITVNTQTSGVYEVYCQDSAGISESKKIKFSLQ
ncbi:conserved repeat domain protein (plasmid) [Emticicia oligotrophica DSM 17448]|uniref:Conserved repeat domain protein n=1 Tax=Emticicia oligotrophica (strain DSM 17448 / CIP 109782 / MTCC 6937 / GPTSA100-15) TaxID=929562 RepID=A0ABM5N7L7_EMTOG|nr:hypothetical protein [Emticicia oligotrophica]AFK05445.1 conserved repeat domain protein [Emticicia oligotrophica DSM 17448]